MAMFGITTKAGDRLALNTSRVIKVTPAFRYVGDSEERVEDERFSYLWYADGGESPGMLIVQGSFSEVFHLMRIAEVPPSRSEAE